MMMTVDDVKKSLTSALPEAWIQVESPDDVHFSAVVVCESFEGKTRVARHRDVYAALGDAFDGPLHALGLTTLTPAQAKERGIELS